MDYKERKTADYLDKIKQQAHLAYPNCTQEKCPAFSDCPQMPSQGDRKHIKKQLRIFFTFEGASRDDSSFGFPAMSNSGIFFRENFLAPFLKEVGDVPYLITNLVRTALFDSVKGAPRSATEQELIHCWDNYYEELMKHKPEVIVVFGGTAFSQMYKRSKNKKDLPETDAHAVGKLRAKPVRMELASDYTPLVFTTYAPSYILRTPASVKFFTEDLAKVVEYFCPDKKVADKTKISIKKVELLDSVESALEFIEHITNDLPRDEYFDLAFDTETDNLNKVHNNKFLSWQFSYKEGEAFFIPIDHQEKPIFADVPNKVKLIKAFQAFLNSSPEKTRVKWILAHNAKFDLGVLYGLFKILPRGSIPIWDTMLAMHWLDENRKSLSAFIEGTPYSLKTLGKELFDFSYSSEALAARSEGELQSLSFEDLVDYGGSDTILTWHLKQEQMKLARLQPNQALVKLERFMRYYYSPASRAVAVMECNGLYVDKEHLKYLQGQSSPIWNRMEQIENIELQERPEILEFREKFRKVIEGESTIDYEDAWEDEETSNNLPLFNPNKKEQEKALYLKFLELEPLTLSKKTGQASLDADFLTHYADKEVYISNIQSEFRPFYSTPIEHDDDGSPIFHKNPLQLILEYRGLKKLGSTYTSNIETMVSNKKGDCVDGRIRASFWLASTDTGRWTSSDPNLQQLPGKTKIAKEVKNIFQSEPPSKKFPEGTALVQLDYKTAEVRWAAIYAKDKNMIRIFNDARKALLKACDPELNMSDAEFAKTQLDSDIHRRTAALMFNVTPEKVTKAQRQASKCLVGSTLLYTNKGILPIESLVTDKEDSNWLQPVTNISVASHKGSVPIKWVNHKWVESTIKVDTAIGVSIQGDEEHPLMVWENCQLIPKLLKDIKKGDFLVKILPPDDSDYTKSMLIPVTNTSIVPGIIKVYDIEVDDEDHMFGANGFLSKNCITFGLFFGMGVETLAADNGWSVPEAEERIEMFFSAFPQIKAYLDNMPTKAKESGYVETILGRRRRLGSWFKTKDFRLAAKANRLAQNAPIQGQSSDAGTLGLCSFLQYLLDNNLERRWLIQNAVHDSCLIQIPMGDIEKALPIIQHHFVIGMKEYISKYFKFELPLPIDCELELGVKYGDLTAWDGRPSTLSVIIEKIKKQAKELWEEKKKDDKIPAAILDLVKDRPELRKV